MFYHIEGSLLNDLLCIVKNTSGESAEQILERLKKLEVVDFEQEKKRTIYIELTDPTLGHFDELQELARKAKYAYVDRDLEESENGLLEVENLVSQITVDILGD